ncbi:hypothetical protein [Halosimplex salinum]|uniref:hypothetical protein n=1 Tax=Halosimplex salinum TaxID=1710538 RepID=UPI0013DD9495|nr:hypothetical protein [Halosimplex salinum]
MADRDRSRWDHFGDPEHANRDSEGETPTKEDLIKGYIQYSEESRYRDGIMHNSYYFVLVAVVLFSGHVLSLEFNAVDFYSYKFGILLFTGGIVTFGISVVMKTYNRKRINAEHRRDVLEQYFDDHFSSDGIFKIDGTEPFSPREKDNPFAIQRNVLRRNRDTIEDVFQGPLKVQALVKFGIWGGLLTGSIGLGILSYTVLQSIWSLF